MPDISKLPELAELFCVSIDELLGDKSELVESAVNGEFEKYLANNDVTSEQLCDVVPLLKPDQVDAVVENVKTIPLCDIEELLPFLNQSTIDELARKMIQENQNIAEIAPFVSRDIISELAELNYRKHGFSSLEDIAPFLSREQLQRIAKEEYDARGLRHFEAIAPFLNREYLNHLASDAIQKNGIKAISSIAPFLDREMLSEYVKEKYL